MTNNLVDQQIDVKIKLAALWVAHFLIWSFGDILRFLSPEFLGELPISNEELLFIAPIGILQAIMIVVSVILKGKPNRYANLILGVLYFGIDIAYLTDNILNQYPAWEILLTVVYIAFDAMIIWFAYKWHKVNGQISSSS
ncbi:MAG: hypothetical protein ACFFAJ_14020 [Candidatus Hodarchaeota archaeon]